MAQLTRTVIDSEHFVTRYVQGRLSQPELEAFEEFCLMHPDVAKQVAVDHKLREGLRAMETPVPARVKRAWLPFALAAGIAIMAALALASYFRGRHPQVLSASAQSLPIAPAHRAGPFRVVRLRGGSVQTFEVPAATGAVTLEIEPSDTAGVAAVDVALLESVDGAWQPRGELAQLPANADGAFTLAVDVTALRGPLLRLAFSGADGRVDEFDFRVVASR